jgi:hypothetical protein
VPSGIVWHMGTETLRAHCSAATCTGRMMLHVKRDPATGIESAFWYACLECGTLTDQRATAEKAAEDVVWVPAKQRKAR